MNTQAPLAHPNGDEEPRGNDTTHVSADPAAAPAAAVEARNETPQRHASMRGAASTADPGKEPPVHQPPPAPRPTVRYSRTVRLSVPIIADGETIRALYTAAAPTAATELDTVAEQLGLTPPSANHPWAIGWSGPASAADRRLVWYDPDKLRGIDDMIDRVVATHPAAREVIVVQGTGWDDWGVAFTADDIDDADGPEEDVPGGSAGTPVRGDRASAAGGSTGKRGAAGERLLDVPVPQAANGIGDPAGAPARGPQPAALLPHRAGVGEHVAELGGGEPPARSVNAGQEPQ